MRNPWSTIASKEVYKNAWIRVREDEVTRPDGTPGIYGVVEMRGATGVVALTEDDEIVLVGQYRYPIQEYSWEIPEGGVEPGEDPWSTIQRELSEEAGMAASDWFALGGEVHLSNCVCDERGYLFLARGLSARAANPDPTEELLVKTVPFAQALRMVFKGEIRDSLTVIGILLADRVFGGERSLLRPLKK
jgi:8-oxo-dGTP pyrophosphatase MutT (NUDIX family)